VAVGVPSNVIDLVAVWRAAVRACDPGAQVCNYIDDTALHGGRWTVLAVGKSAAAMAAGAIEALGDAGTGDTLEGGLVITVDGAPVPSTLERAVATGAWRLRRAAHPVPDARSEAAGREAIELVRGVPEDGVLLALVSGGASALMAVPVEGMTLGEKAARVSAVMRAGAPIHEINRVRAELSAVKGGKLGRMCRGRVVTLVVSDVVGDDVAVVGSAPTVTGRRDDAAILVSGMDTFRRTAAGVVRMSRPVEEHAALLAGAVEEVAAQVVEVARRLAPGEVWVAGGEWTVTVGERAGKGGRATHLALLVAKAVSGMAGVQVLVAGSDGVDGTGPWAGAIVDGDTWELVTMSGADPEQAIAECDSGTVLAAVGATVESGPTGVNHADVVIVTRSGTGTGGRATEGP
jgi:glycerate 2-kinase